MKLSWEGFVHWSAHMRSHTTYRNIPKSFLYSWVRFFIIMLLLLLLPLLLCLQFDIDATWNWDKSSLFVPVSCHRMLWRSLSDFCKSMILRAPLPTVSKSPKSHFRKIARLFILFTTKSSSVLRCFWMPCAVWHCCTNEHKSQAKTMWLTDNRWEITHNSFFDLLRIYLACLLRQNDNQPPPQWSEKCMRIPYLCVHLPDISKMITWNIPFHEQTSLPATVK